MKKRELYYFNLQWILLLILTCSLLFLLTTVTLMLAHWNDSYRETLSDKLNVVSDQYSAFFREQYVRYSMFRDDPAALREVGMYSDLTTLLEQQLNTDFFALYRGEELLLTSGEGEGGLEFLQLFASLRRDTLTQDTMFNSTEEATWEQLYTFAPTLAEKAALPKQASAGLPVLVKVCAIPLRLRDDSGPLVVVLGRVCNNDMNFIGRLFDILPDYNLVSINTMAGLRVAGSFALPTSGNGDYQSSATIRAIQSGERSYVVAPAGLFSVFQATSYTMCAPLFNHAGTPVGAINFSAGPAQAQAERRRIMTSLLTVTLIVLLFGTVVSYWVSRRLTRPTQSFVQVVQAIDQAESIAPTHLQNLARLQEESLSGIYEFRQLQDAFARMTQSLYEKQEQHVNYIANLEQAVTVRTEDLRLALKEARALSEFKSAFLANISHDIRTPLNSICGFSEMLLERLYGPLNLKQEEYINLVNSCAYHILQIFNDLLEIAMMEQGQVDLKKEPLEMSAFLDMLFTSFTPQALAKQVTLVNEIAADLPTLELDRQRMTRALSNVLDNALKFTPAGGEVRLNAKVQGAVLKCFIRDNGVGIPSSHLPHVFEGFYQTDDDDQGVGLGLSVTWQIVRMHGGVVDIASDLGHYTEVTITLPLEGGSHGNRNEKNETNTVH
jgi:signal transduction histidine kinase